MTATRVRYPYISNWCRDGQHSGCRGEYAGTKCTCRVCSHGRRRVATVTYGCVQ